jgi:hypothetical protein
MDATAESALRGGVAGDRDGMPIPGLAGVEPRFEVDPDGGQVVVTRFECPHLLSVILLLFLHRRVKRGVRRHARGYVGVKLLVDWRRKVVLSVSVWKDIESVYSMGRVDRHITATRIPARIGVRTASGIYCYVGDWRRVMFRSEVYGGSPLQPVNWPSTPANRAKEAGYAHSD